jgi:mxaC protein
MPLPFEHPWALLLLPLALLPWLPNRRHMSDYPSLLLLPVDPLSDAFGTLLKGLATLAILACGVAIADPFFSPEPAAHVGRGAEIVVLLDRSLSMDQSFAGKPRSPGATGVDAVSGGESKNAAARRLLSEFAAHRDHDLIGMVAFSTAPIVVTHFTEKQDVAQAAIAAGGIGHGLADTDMSRGLSAALDMFRDQPYNGSRVILLVSDGGAKLDIAARQHITEVMKREHVALYWLYLRTRRSPGLLADRDVTSEEQDAVPEHFLHQFFSTMGSPYHAYEAENPDSLAQAMSDIDRLQSLPIRYELPRAHRDLAVVAYAIAFVGAALLTLASALEIRR